MVKQVAAEGKHVEFAHLLILQFLFRHEQIDVHCYRSIIEKTRTGSLVAERHVERV